MKAPSFGLSQVPDRKSTDQWLFLARHLGLPTRLLDWTENALLALYFAIHADESDEPIVWMLDPFALNELSSSDHPEREQSGSAQFPLTWFRPEHKINIGHENSRGAWEENRKGVELPVAVQPTYVHPRMSAQRSVFTVQGKSKEPLNAQVSADILRKYEIDPMATDQLRADLRMLGVQETSAFPDLDGLARELAEQY